MFVFGNLLADWKARLAMLLSNRDLSLCDDQIEEAGAKALAQALPDCKKLRSLYLSGNKIGDVGARAIADALPQS